MRLNWQEKEQKKGEVDPERHTIYKNLKNRCKNELFWKWNRVENETSYFL